jgi:hypothetical protein
LFLELRTFQTNVVENIKILWRISKCYGEHQIVVENIKMLWRTSKCCGEHKNIVENIKML